MNSSSPINLGINWQLHDRTGWGVYGLNLALQLLQRERWQPVLLQTPGRLPENPLLRRQLVPLLHSYQQLASLRERVPGYHPAGDNLITLHALGNSFTSLEPLLQGRCDIGVIFFEDVASIRKNLSRAEKFPLIITGSHWNEKVLKGLIPPGRGQVVTVIQGIDPTLFHPAPNAGLLRDRFVIFSGGKLEYRKGQDIVIAAFKRFREKHPEALLLAAWHNSWPETMREIAVRGHVKGHPALTGNPAANLARWLVDNGLPPESFIVIPETPNHCMAPILREADVALFPNRAEGGTNLVAMETMACGVPAILAANTGQLDFADPEICWPLTRQGEVLPSPTFPGVTEWGESDPEEIVAHLESIYSDSHSARQKGRRAAARLASFSWADQISKLLAKLENFFAGAKPAGQTAVEND